jgi:hypothetical protein
MHARIRHVPSAAAEPSTTDELDAAICTLARHMNADSFRMLVLVREFDDRFGWKKWGFRNCAEWLAWRCGLSAGAARDKVRTAQALRLMPRVAEAFADGRLSYSKVRALARVVETHDEETLVAYALSVTAAQVEDRCRQMRNADPDRSSAGALQAWQRRSLTLLRDEARGKMTITVEVPIEEGEVIANAIARAAANEAAALGIEFADAKANARAHDSAESPTLAHGWRAQQADALVAIMKTYLSGGTQRADAPAACADHYQVVVHVDEAALRGGAGRSDLPIDVVKRLACDGGIVTVLEDERGAVLDVGRKQRVVSTPLRRALLARDRHCSFPGCRYTRYVHAHHVRHWADGGETSLENLMLLCSHHHKLLHEGGFRTRRDAAGEILFQRPDGRVIPKHGYRLEDQCDDFADDEPASAEACGLAAQNDSAESCALTRLNDSAESWMASRSARNGCAEVRETRGVYLAFVRSFESRGAAPLPLP